MDKSCSFLTRRTQYVCNSVFKFLVILLFSQFYCTCFLGKNSHIRRKPLLTHHVHQSEVRSTNEQSKRGKIRSAVVATGTLLVATLCGSKNAFAARGAFEMDAEFYFQNLLGNRKEKNDMTATNRIVYPSPRKLNSDFAHAIYSLVLTELSGAMKIDKLELIARINEKLPAYLALFRTFAPITSETIDDQYYFDMVLLIAYRLAGETVRLSEDRIKLRKNIGVSVLELLKEEKFISEIPKTNNKLTPEEKFVRLGSYVEQILTAFKRTGLIGDYKFDIADVDDYDYAKASFEQNLPVSFQVTLVSPVTLLSFVKQSESNTFYHPEIIGTTINSCFLAQNFKSRFEDYLLDNFYREENFDVQAQDILLEFIVAC